MPPGVIKELAAKELPTTPAILSGYRRFAIDGQCYPGVKHEPRSFVQGLVMDADEDSMKVF